MSNYDDNPLEDIPEPELHVAFLQQPSDQSPIIRGTIDADEIKSTNVANQQFIGKQYIVYPPSSQDQEAFSSLSPRDSSIEPRFLLPEESYSKFIGRERDLQRLHHLLLSPDAEQSEKLVGIAGMGGVGKSSLAISFATDNQSNFPDGIIFKRIDHRSANELAQELARDAGIKINFQDKASKIMKDCFQQKRMLLILDNAEDDRVARELLPGKGPCSVIITSRNSMLLNKLKVSSEKRIDLTGLLEEDAWELVCQFLDTEQVELLEPYGQELYSLLGGLPLALQIVGGYLQALQGFTKSEVIQEYVANLRDEKQRFEILKEVGGYPSDENGPYDKNNSVRASFQLSWNVLDEKKKKFFACLSACDPRGFSEKAALAVGEQHAALTLAELCLYNLCTKGQGERYTLHPLLYTFAREKAEELHLLDEAEWRHTEYFIAYVEEHKALTPADFEALADELDVLIPIGEHLIENMPLAVDFYMTLKPLLKSRGYWDRAFTWIEILLEAAQKQKNTYYEVFCMLQYETFLHQFGQYEEAEQILIESEQLARRVEDAHHYASLLARLRAKQGGLYRDQHKLAEAEEALQEALELWQDLNSLWDIAKVLNKLGGLYQSFGKWPEAEDALVKSLSIYEQLQAIGRVGVVLNTLSMLYQNRKDLQKAKDALDRALSIAEQLGDRKSIGIVKGRLADVYRAQGNKNAAKEAIKQHLEIVVEMRDSKYMASILHRLKDLYVSDGKAQEALSIVNTQLAILYKKEDKKSIAIFLNVVGDLYLHLKDLANAEKALTESLNTARDIAEQRVIGNVLKTQAKMFLALKQPQDALKALQTSLQIFRSLEDRQEVGTALRELGSFYDKQGNNEQASECFQECFNIQEAEHSPSISKTTQRLVHILLKLRKKELARRYCKRALVIVPDNADVLRVQRRLSQNPPKTEDLLQSLQEKHKDQNTRENYITLYKLGSHYVNQGRMREAQEYLEKSLTLGREKGNRTHVSMVLSTLAEMYQKQGKMRLAEEVLAEHITIATGQDKIHLGIVIEGLGNRYKVQGRYEQMEEKYVQASRILQECFDEQEKLRNTQLVAEIAYHLVHVLLPLRKREIAWEYWYRAQAVTRDNPLLLEAEKRLRKFTRDVDLLRIDLELAEERKDWKQVRLLSSSLGEVYVKENKFPEAEEVLCRSLQLGEEQGNQRHVCMVQNILGEVYLAQGKLSEAEEILHASKEHGEALDDQKHIGVVLNNLGKVYLNQGNMQEAEKALLHSLTIGETLQDQTLIKLVLHTLGKVYQEQNKWQDAEQMLLQSLTIARALNDKKHIMLVQQDLYVLYQAQGRNIEADEALAEANKIEGFLRCRDRVGLIIKNMREIAQRVEKQKEAEQVLLEVAELERDAENNIGVAMTVNLLGTIYLEQQRILDAEKAFLDSLPIAKEQDDKALMETILFNLGRLYLKVEDYPKASSSIQECFSLQEQRKADSIGETTSVLVHVLLSIHRREIVLAQQYYRRAWAIVPNDPALLKVRKRIFKEDEDEEALRDSLRTYKTQENMQEIAFTLHKLGKLCKNDKTRLDEAEKLFIESLDIGEKLNLTRHKCIVLRSLGELYASQGKTQKAEQTLEKCYTLMVCVNDKTGMASVQETRGKLFLDRGEFEQASECMRESFTIYMELRAQQGITTLYFLVKALIRIHKAEEALAHYQRALSLWSGHHEMQKMQKNLDQLLYIYIQPPIIKVGRIKFLKSPNSQGFFFGFITPDDGSPDIYFAENVVVRELMGRLQKNVRVCAEVQVDGARVKALKVWAATKKDENTLSRS